MILNYSNKTKFITVLCIYIRFQRINVQINAFHGQNKLWSVWESPGSVFPEIHEEKSGFFENHRLGAEHFERNGDRRSFWWRIGFEAFWTIFTFRREPEIRVCLNTAKYCFTSPISESLECVCMDIHMNKRLTSSSIFWISELLPIDVCVNKVTRSHFIGVRCTRWNELTVITLKRWFLRNSSYKVCCWELWEICRFRILPSSEFPSGLEGPTTKRTSTKMTP